MRRIKISLTGKFFIGIVLTVVPVLGLIFAWTGIRNEKHATSQVINQARILARQIIMTRQWIADCGGIMVDRDSLGAQGALNFYDDQLKTKRGVFQRFTPAMVTKKLSHYSMRENMYQFRLASINPLNPQNSPDTFEKMALYSFIHKDTQEVFYFDENDKLNGFRYSVPLYVEDACLRCHRNFTKGTISGEEDKSYLALIENNLLRLAHLVTDMLDLTRIEAGKVIWNFENNDLTVLVREVIEILGLKAGERAITLNYPDRAPIWVAMDLERIEQVLVNLIENAIKFSNRGSRIEIDTHMENGQVKISVRDFGIGIAEKDLETIFRKFHTLPSSGGTGQTKGTGLGLTICRKIVEAHGGKIWAQGQPGRGSVFTFTLPLEQSPGVI